MEEINSQIINIYQSGKSMRQTASILNVTPDKVKYILHKYNINTQKTTKDYPCYRKHQIDLNYFKEINTEAKAYFLGLIAADGYVNNTGLYLTLKKSDKHILETFIKELQTDLNVIKPFGDDYYKINIHSVNFAQDLHNQGIMQAKSKILKSPSLPNKLIPHYIRGYFDGNGSIWYDKNVNNYRVQFVGAKDVINYIQKFFGTNLKIRNATKDGAVTRYGFSGNRQIMKLLSKIYNSSSSELRLEKKYKKYLDCVELNKYKDKHRNEIWINNLGPYVIKQTY